MTWQKAKKLLVWAFLALMGIFILYVIVAFGPGMIKVLKSGDEAALEAYVTGAGKGGVVIIVALQVLQTITIVFPGIPIYMASGVIFGRLMGTIICYITYVVSNSAVFLFSRKLGDKANEIFLENNKSSNEESVKGLLAKTKHPCILVGALCMIPVIPNGLVPHLAAQTDMRFVKFVESVAVGCIPGILLFVAFGDLLMSKYFKLILGIIIAVLVLTLLGFLFKGKMTGWMNKLLGKYFGGEE